MVQSVSAGLAEAATGLEFAHTLEDNLTHKFQGDVVVMNDRLIARFGERILSLDTQTLFLWGTLTARLESAGQPAPVMDGLIAATALQHNLLIATRNVVDFLPCGVQVVNPWE